MPRYNYECLNCLKKTEKKYFKQLTELGHINLDIIEQEVLFETSHAMEPTEAELHDARECPRCGSHNTQKAFYALNVTTFTKGYGFLDRAGCHRDMNNYKLTQEDPYGEYRQPGEVEHVKSQLAKGGKHDPKTKYFVNSQKSMEKAVSDSVISKNKPQK